MTPPMLGGFGVGRWFGFQIRIDYSWFLVFFLVVWTFQRFLAQQIPGYTLTAYYVMSTVAGLVFFLSVLLHELAHSVVARSRGIEVEGITLFIFGGVAETRMEARRALDEFLLTIAGPLMSLALAAAFWGVASSAGSLGWPPPVQAVAGALAWLNLVLAVFNMVPGFPLDGGRIFRSVVWAVTGDLEKATRWATRGGRVFGYLLVGLGIVEVLAFGQLLAGLWSAFIGWFLASAAGASYRHFAVRRMLSRVRVERVMTAGAEPISPAMPVAELVEEYFMRRPHGAYPVVENGHLLGLVGVGEVSGLGMAQRALSRVGDVMRPIDELPTASADETLDEVIGRLDPGEEERAVVVEDGRVVGFLTLDDIGEWVKRARELGMT